MTNESSSKTRFTISKASLVPSDLPPGSPTLNPFLNSHHCFSRACSPQGSLVREMFLSHDSVAHVKETKLASDTKKNNCVLIQYILEILG